ncbi:MAG: GNAT family N-acetyltransferase [Thermoplasmata archaeon]
MIVRSPKPEDNEELIELDRIAPEEGLVSYYVDRRPTYIRRPDSENFFPYVAEEDGRVVGAVFCTLDNLYVNGNHRRCGYISSLRVHPQYRKKGIGSSLISRAIDRGMEEGAEIFWAVVIGKNLASLRTFQKCGFSRVGGFGFRILTMRRRKMASGALLREATENDLEDMTEIISSFYDKHNFKPEVTEKWLMSRYKIKKRSLGSFYVAERNEGIVATLRAVRQWYITKMIITRLSWKVKLANLFFRLGIREGSLLKILDLSDLSYVPGEEMACYDLIDFAKRKYRRECRIAYIQYALGGNEERFMAKSGGLPGYTDVMAVIPNRRLRKLDPIFPLR